MKLTTFRIILSMVLIYFSYLETGIFTAITLSLILITIESITFLYRKALRILNKKLKELDC